MADAAEEQMIKETLEEQEDGAPGELTDTGEPMPVKAKPAKKAKPIAAKGGAFIDANEKKASKAIRMKELEKEERQNRKVEAAKNKRLAAEKARVERELDEGKKRAAESRTKAEEKAKMATKKTAAKGKVRGGKPKAGAHAEYEFGKRLGDDETFVATMARYIKKHGDGASWSTVIKAMRADGHAAGQKRAQRLFSQAQKVASGKVKAKA